MRGANRNAALALRDLRLRTISPGRQTRSADATPEQSRISNPADSAKRTAKIDVVPFVASMSPVCRTADTVMVFGVALLGLTAAVAACLSRVM